MSKVLYVHDLPFIKDNESYFSASFTDDYFSRFTEAGYKKIDIISRVIELEVDSSSYNLLGSDYLTVHDFVGSNYKRLFYPKNIATLFRLVRASDLIVISTPSVIGLFVSLLCFVSQKNYVCEVAGDYTAFETKKFGGLITKVLHLYMPWLIRMAVGATYVTHDLAKRYHNNNSLIGSNVNIRNVYPKDNYSLSNPSTLSIGFVGGLVERKGIRTIVKAAVILKNKYPEFKYEFNFIGGHSDNDWSSLCTFFDVTELCSFQGIKQRSEVDESLRTFDIYIQPSFSEGVPRATIEAMSHGLPVIATTLPGFHEILPFEFLFQPGNENILADKIYAFAISEKLRRESGQINLLRAEDFLFSTLNQKRVNFYKKIFDKTKG